MERVVLGHRQQQGSTEEGEALLCKQTMRAYLLENS